MPKSMIPALTRDSRETIGLAAGKRPSLFCYVTIRCITRLLRWQLVFNQADTPLKEQRNGESRSKVNAEQKTVQKGCLDAPMGHLGLKFATL